jgi:hypothetical protein
MTENDDTQLSPLAAETQAAPTADVAAGPVAWSAETSSQPVADYIEESRWRKVLPKVLLGLAASLAIGAIAALIFMREHHEQTKPPREAPVTQAAPRTVTVPQAAPTIQPAARIVGFNLQLQGTPEDWDVTLGELYKLGIEVQINVVGVITHLQFVNYDKAPDNWVRWYTEHVPSEPFHGDPSLWNGALLAGQGGLPFPPPPEICYADDGTPVPIQRFPGPYIHCGPTPGAVAGH